MKRKNICSGPYDGQIPSDRDKLIELLSTIENLGEQTNIESSSSVTLMAVPHIDWGRGAKVYGSFLRALKQLPDFETIVILGVNHQSYDETQYHLTPKQYHTPLFECIVDKTARDILFEGVSDEERYKEAWVHDEEWSIELCLPFIQSAFDSQGQAKIVPIVVSSMEHFLGNEMLEANSVVSNFVANLSKLISRSLESDTRLLVLLSVDLAHCGRYFGQKVQAAGVRETEIVEHDLQLLDSLKKASSFELHRALSAEENRYNWDGFACLYTAFAAFEQAGVGLEGELLDYLLTVRSEEDCLVSFASMFWKHTLD